MPLFSSPFYEDLLRQKEDFNVSQKSTYKLFWDTAIKYVVHFTFSSRTPSRRVDLLIVLIFDVSGVSGQN